MALIRNIIIPAKNPFVTKLKVEKPMLALFIILNIFFGLNFGFITHVHKRIQPFARVMSMISPFFMLFIMSFPISEFYPQLLWVTWYLLRLIEYITLFFIFTFTKYNFYDFVNDVHRVHKTSPKVKRSFTTVAIYTFLANLVLKFGCQLLFCVLHGHEFCDKIFGIPVAIYFPATLILDTTPLLLALISYYKYSFVKKINYLIKYPQVCVEQVENLYLEVANIIDKISPLYDSLVTADLLFEAPKLMFMLCYVINDIKLEIEWGNYINEIVSSLDLISRILIPSIMTEILTHEMESTKLELHIQLLKEKNKEVYKKKIRLLRYMEARRLDHKVWHVLPVDMRMPLSVLSICATYIIVIIQFTD